MRLRSTAVAWLPTPRSNAFLWGAAMHAETAIRIQGPLSRIVALASDVERWPDILPHYRWVTLLDGGGDRKVVEMAARRGRFPLRWRAVQTIDRCASTPIIAYHHIWGPTRGMDVAWTFAKTVCGVDVTIVHDFRPPWPLVGDAVADRIIGPHFIEYVARRTLSTIKAIVEREGAELDAP
jgi:ribosome-associated toxin RatA of RatAB toxin-antitoxin module